MTNNNFFIPENYKCNEQAITYDINEISYWNKERIQASLSYQAHAYKWAEKIIGENKITKIADVGCGSAAKLNKLHHNLPDLECWAFDQPNAIKVCKKNYDFGNWQGLNFDKPESLPNIKFEFIISSDVIEHLNNPDNILNIIKHLLHENGLAIITTPEREILRGNDCLLSPNPYHVREWSQAEFKMYLESNGFQVIDHKCLPAFNCFSSWFFFKRAMRRWIKNKTIKYNQAALVSLSKK